MRLFFLIILSFQLVNCANSAKNKSLLGTWQSCGKDGLYVEFLVKEKLFKQIADNKIVTNWIEYKIIGDTMISYDPYLIKDSICINKAIMLLSNENEFSLDFITSNEKWTFHRISDSIKDSENNEILIQNVIENAKKRKCPDLRTEDQKKKDSLNSRMIYFQF